MIVYLFLLVCNLVALPLLKGKARKVLGMLIFFAMFLLCSLRGYNVGTDTEAYYDFYKYGSFRMEPLFVLLREMCLSLGLGVRGLLFLSALLTYIPLVMFLLRESKDILFSSLIYLSFSVMFFHQTFNIVRACIAISFMLWALHFLVKKRYRYSSVFLIISCLFHYSAIIIFLIVAITFIIRKLNFKFVFIAISLSLLFGMSTAYVFSDFSQELLALTMFTSSDLGDYYNNYLREFNESNLNIVGLSANLLPLSLLCVLIYKGNGESLYYKLFFIGCLMQNVFVSITYAYRFYLYFTILIIFLLPNSYCHIRGLKKLQINAVCIFFVLFYVFQCMTATPENRGLAGTVPYYFYWNE